ncbi:hypothetical protein CO613_10580 [Lysobacteraceae bacterium NML07-0707]|nr:hypothetical protein CO613_10580 [Xanthomonadaceae bacterium NML07-0707]
MTAIDWHRLAAAIADDDLDSAIELGLLRWNGDTRSLAAAGLADAQIHLITRLRDERLTALAARERYRNRQARLSRQEAERKQRQAQTLATSSSGKPALSGAAAAALARALAKAKR